MEIPIQNIYYLLSYSWGYFSFNKKDSLDEDSYENNTEFLSETISDLIDGWPLI